MESHQKDSPEFFSGLDKQTLARIARNWAEEYPVIKRVTLFRGRATESFKYVLLVQYNETDPEGLELFRAWSFGHEDCGHVITELADAYKLLPEESRYKDEWIWFPEPLGREPPSEFIVPEEFMVLYNQEETDRMLFHRQSEKEVGYGESLQIAGEMDEILVEIEKSRSMPVHSINEKNIRDKEIGEKTHQYNELGFYSAWNNVIGGKCEPEPLTEYGQKRIADAALSSGFIGLWDLVYLLAADKRYQDLIPPLWKEYQCDVRGPKSPDVSTVQSRVVVWQALLFRWAHGMVSGVRGGLRAIPYLPLHCFDERTGRYERRDSKDFIECSDNGPEYASLEDLGKYLTDVVRVPLPHILFAEASEPLDRQRSENVSNGLTVEEVKKEKHEGPEALATTPMSHDEDFIKGLKIFVENDQEIVIQQPGKRKILYNYTKVGFQTANKTWRDLLGILQDPEYCYDLGQATGDPAKRRDYDARRKRLEEINKKLVILFNKEFSLTLPKNYKLHERDKTKKAGTYSFMFRKVSSQDKKRLLAAEFEKLDGVQLLAEIERLALKRKQYENRGQDSDAGLALELLTSAANSGLKRGVITKDQIKNVLFDKVKGDRPL